ncbi:MAG: alcohol dehydrogenase [Promethearchaeota archaeon]|nr:MAG: alcohol dehydrogenase [Candidatus Lokiarchaeota archaeon]
MKALTLTIDKYIQLRQKQETDINFRPNIYDLVELKEVPDVNLINENWVKIKVKIGGICGADLNLLSLKTSTCLSNFSSFPAIPGHEIVGLITEVGSNVKNISIGDKVIIDENLGCEARGLVPCDSCSKGEYNLCSNYDKGDLSPGAIIGYCKDTGGSWGEFVVAHKSQVLKIPESVSFEQALVAEPLACAIHGIFKHLPRDDENCVVIGCGTIGLATILALKSFSNCNIIATAKYAFQSELAEKLGADEVFLVKKDLHIKKIGRKLGCRILSPVMEDALPIGGGADIVIDSVGNASSLANSMRLVKAKGTVILIGYPSYLEIDWTPFMAKETHIVASNIFSNLTINNEKKRTLQVALDLIESGQANVKNFISHKFSINDYKKAFEVASNKSQNNSIKTVFIYD